jgi:hypothetical protein
MRSSGILRIGFRRERIGYNENRTMTYDPDRSIAVLTKAVAVCRGMLYSARTGDASQGEIERILDGTSAETLAKLIGKEACDHAMHLSEILPAEDSDVLLSIKDEPYSVGVPVVPNRAKLKMIIECLLSMAFSKDEEAWLFAAGKAVSPDPAWSDYVYWPERFGLDGSVEAALDRAFAYLPINLPRP